MPTVAWLEAPQPHDFPAAAAYLALLASDGQVTALVKKPESSVTTHQKAKDLLRAFRLPLLIHDVHVVSDGENRRRSAPVTPSCWCKVTCFG